MLSRTPTTPGRLLRVGMFAMIAAAVLVMGTRISGQAPVQPVSPFDMVGFIQKATLDNPADFLSGGSMTINGHVVTVPKNTILQMPAAALTWQEVWAMAPLPYGLAANGGNGLSGLATTDSPAPLATYEVHVQGNRIIDATGDHYIAGLIFISQQSLNVGQGFINYIDYGKGEMRIGGILGDSTTGARVRINDPYQKFSKGDPNADKRFTIDEDNPTVRTQTGYPLCLPRQDPAIGDDQYCPARNRPQTVPPAFDSVVGGNPFWFEPGGNNGQLITKYDGTTYNALALGGLADSLLPAPFEVGDYVEYAGTLVADPAGASGPQAGPYPLSAPSGGVGGVPNAPSGTYISAFQMIANLGFYTHPGSSPVYVAIDVMLMGTGGLNTATAPQEATLRTRVEGFSTDPFGAAFTGAIVGGGGKKVAGGAGTAINIYAMDVDCTGTYTDRAWITGVASDVGVVFGGAVAGRWRFRPSSGIFLPPPRNLRATMSDPRGVAGARFVTANLPPKPGSTVPQGLETGQYNAPIFTYIFPENLVIGGPPIGANFNDFPFLANGSGNYTGMSGQAGVIGQLSPWPLIPAPTVSCAAGTGGTGTLFNPPQVVASASSASVNSGALVTLSATATDLNLPAQNPVTLSWTGPSGVALSSTSGSPVTFIAPPVTIQTTLNFTVTATNAANLSSSVQVSVAVNPAPIVQAGAPSLSIAAFIGASNSIAGSGTALLAPYQVAYGAVGVQIVAKSTAQTASNGVSINWIKPTSPSISISGPSNQTNSSTGQVTSWVTFNATWINKTTGGAGLIAGNPPQPLSFTVSTKDNKTGATQTQVVTVTVMPPPDALTALVKYRTGTGGGGKGARMDVTVTTTAQVISDPNTMAVLSPQFTLTFVVSDPTDVRFGQTVVWNSWAMVLGVPTATVLGYPMPTSVTVTSSAGGSVTVSSANFTIK